MGAADELGVIEDALQGGDSDGAEPTSWQLEWRLRRVTFARSRELSVFSETTSVPMSALHAHPAWTLLLPVDGGTVKVISDYAVLVHDNGVLLAPQSQYRSAADGPHVAVYANAWRTARPQSMSPRVLGAASVRRLLDALDVDGRTNLSAAMIELVPLVGRSAPIDSRLAFVIEALPDADRLDVLADEVGLSPSRLRALAHTEVGVSLTQLRLWSRLGRAIAWLPYGPTARAAAEAGFADQAHLTRVARRFLGRTPGELLARSVSGAPCGRGVAALQSATGGRGRELGQRSIDVDGKQLG